MRTSRDLAPALLAFILVAAACGGGSNTDAGAGDNGEGEPIVGEIISQDALALDEDAVTTTTASVAGDDGAGAASEGSDDPGLDASTDTIPQEEQTADDEFFDSVGVFMSCMNVEVGGFIGIPDFGDDADLSLPENAPSYREGLFTCASRSDIVNAMEAAEDSSRFSAEEIEDRNRGFVEFRKCLIGRGWTIPDPSPDENGLLFSSYIEAGRDWKAPNGESILDTDDFVDCAESGNPFGGGEPEESNE